MNIHRRGFIGTAVTAGILSLVDSSFSGLLAGNADRVSIGLFDSPDAAVLKLADEIYRKCILGMTCTVITMILDGLCQKHQLRIKAS